MAKDNPDLGSSDFNVRLKFDNLFGRGLVISKVDPTNVMAGLQEQEAHQKAKTTIPTSDTSEAVPDPLPLESDGGERTTTQDNHVPGKDDSSPGGSDGQAVVEAPSPGASGY